MPDQWKQKINQAELLAMLANTLTAHSLHCKGLCLDKIEIYPEARNGANWNAVVYSPPGEDRDCLPCQRAVAESIQMLRLLYDVT
jgi:hypothetical protein